MRIHRFIFWFLATIKLGMPSGLINSSFIQNNILPKAHWAQLHGATQQDIGAAMLYYGLVYSAQAKLCVCLGSGDGFVPRIMRQAQRDLNLKNSKTIVIDGNTGNFGRPTWLHEESFFKKQYPDIQIIIDTTKNVARSQAKNWKIDYLHIDADRTTKGALQDFLDYIPFMNQDGIITLHDVGPGRPCALTAHLIEKMGYPIIIFENFGTGVALIKNQISHSDPCKSQPQSP